MTCSAPSAPTPACPGPSAPPPPGGSTFPNASTPARRADAPAQTRRALWLSSDHRDDRRSGREGAPLGQGKDPVHHFGGVDPVQGQRVTCPEVGDELLKRGLSPGETAEVKVVLDRPVSRGGAKRRTLKARHVAGEELAALEHREAECALSRAEPVRQAGQRA